MSITNTGFKDTVDDSGDIPCHIGNNIAKFWKTLLFQNIVDWIGSMAYFSNLLPNFSAVSGQSGLFKKHDLSEFAEKFSRRLSD